MNSEQKQQAETLFFQTGLSKTQIADVLGISRRSVFYWSKEGNWQRLKDGAAAMPSIIAENCYHMMGHLTEHILSEDRRSDPVTRHEADTLHKLTLTVGKLQGRTVLNESMEILTSFLHELNGCDAELAQQLGPFIRRFMAGRALKTQQDYLPAHYCAKGRIPTPPPADPTEALLDQQDLAAWDLEQAVAAVSASAASVPGEPASAVADAVPEENRFAALAEALEQFEKLTRPQESKPAPQHKHKRPHFKQKSPFRKELDQAFARSRAAKAA